MLLSPRLMTQILRKFKNISNQVLFIQFSIVLLLYSVAVDSSPLSSISPENQVIPPPKILQTPPPHKIWEVANPWDRVGQAHDMLTNLSLNPLTLKISVFLLTVCQVILTMLVWRIWYRIN